MKPYKLKRKQKMIKERYPNRVTRNILLIKTVKETVLEDFGCGYYYIVSWDSFCNTIISLLRGKIKLTYADVNGMYSLYKECFKTLLDKKNKIEFIGQKYKPLPEDLFEL